MEPEWGRGGDRRPWWQRGRGRGDDDDDEGQQLLRLFHDENDGGQGQVTNPDQGQGIFHDDDEGQQLFHGESEGQKLLEALP